MRYSNYLCCQHLPPPETFRLQEPPFLAGAPQELDVVVSLAVPPPIEPMVYLALEAYRTELETIRIDN